jgi:hypothetical protein
MMRMFFSVAGLLLVTATMGQEKVKPVQNVINDSRPSGSSRNTSCSAIEIIPGVGTAIDLTNAGVGTEPGEIHPPQGNCQALGFWCDGWVQNSVWAKFTVPDAGAYEISTCHHGTTFDTQIACYIPTGCIYTLYCYDSFGDGWNGGFVTMTVNGVATNHTLPDGSFGTIPILVQGNENFTVHFTHGGWPEEVSFQLVDPSGVVILDIQPTPPQGLLYSGVTNCSGDLCNMSSFQMISASDDVLGECAPPTCVSEPPSCIDQGSAAFNNVIAIDPFCCNTFWDSICQSSYDSMSSSCTGGGGATSCVYTLNGWDSFGDGWNDGFVTFTINGFSTNYTIPGGSSGSWPIVMNPGDVYSVAWTNGGWPEEASIQLLDPSGTVLFYVNQNAPNGMPPTGTFFNGIAFCQGVAGAHPGTSKCYVSCLEPGTTVYVQIDGKGFEAGKLVLSVKPFTDQPSLSALVTGLECPLEFGTENGGVIIPQISGWGTNYSSEWTGPNGFVSEDSYLYNIAPGTYTLNAVNACGQHMQETFQVTGPTNFNLPTSITETCVGLNSGSASIVPTGGTPPYTAVWSGPDGFQAGGNTIQNVPGGQYFYQLTDINGCSVLHSVFIEAHSYPVVDLGANVTLCPFQTYFFLGPEAETYSWSTGSNFQNTSVNGGVLGVGSHTVSLTATNGPGCSTNGSIVVTVESCLGMEESEFPDFTLYPNPASGQVWIDGVTADVEWISLYSSDGRLVLRERNANETKIELNIGTLSPGLYVIELLGDNSASRRKLTIR